MDWNDAHVLLALLRAKSLEAAGARLGVDPSTVSRRLSTLEKRTKTRLFARTREGLLPTEAGERLLAPAEAMEAAMASFVRALGAGASEPRGTVRIATTEGLARMLVQQGLLEVCDAHPGLEIEIVGANRPVDLAHGDADLAIRLSALKQPSLKARCVASMSIGLFAAPAYVRARGPVRELPDLAGHDALVPSGELARLPEAELLATQPRVRVALRSNSMAALIAAASAGRGIVPLPRAWGESEATLSLLLVLEAIPERKVWLAMHEAASDRPAVRVVAERVASIFGRVFPR